MDANSLKAEYAYLDEKVSMECWLWEFIRRNGEYKHLFEELETLLQGEALEASDDVVLTASDMKLHGLPIQIKEKINHLEKKFGVKPNMRVSPLDDSSYLIKKIAGMHNFCMGLPRPERRYCDFRVLPIIKGAKPIEARRFSGKAVQLMSEDEEKFQKYCYKMITKISPALDIANTLYVGISLNAKKEDVRKELEELIKEHCSPLKVRAHTEKWRYYLITYDLRTHNEMSYDRIADLLTMAYPEGKPGLFDEQNLMNYKRNAVILISSGYKTYMYL